MAARLQGTRALGNFNIHDVVISRSCGGRQDRLDALSQMRGSYNRVVTMTNQPHESPTEGEPPNPLDFPVKDPLKEAYEGRWQQLPVIQKIGVFIMLGFWCVLITVLVWDNGRMQYLNTALVFAIVITILGAFFLLLRKHIR